MFDIDFRKFVFSLLPFSLRRSVGEFFALLSSPFKRIHSRFLQYSYDLELMPWILRYDWTVYSMERMLNDCFDCTEDRRIYIIDGEPPQSCIIYPREEENPQILTLTITSHLSWASEPFVIMVPAELYDDSDNNIINRIKRLADIQKLYGLQYRLERYA